MASQAPAASHATPGIPSPISSNRRSHFPSAFRHDDADSDNSSPSPHLTSHPHNSHQQQQRAASQPSRASPESALAYDQIQRRLEESISTPPRASTSPIRKLSTSSAAWPPAIARPNPAAGSRSVSFSTFSEQQASSTIHHNGNANSNSSMSALMAHLNQESTRFPSTFEKDDESVDDDNYDYATPRRQSSNTGRSRPQSIGPGPSTSTSERRSQQQSTGGIRTSFGSSYGFTQGYGIPGSQPSPINTTGKSYDILGYRPPSATIDDHTNMSPFLRDVSQIPPESGTGAYSSRGGGSGLGGGSHHHYGSAATYGHSSSHHMWGGNGGIGTAANSYSGAGGLGDDVHNGGGSGTQSRRHSVSVLQPRRISVGFNIGNASQQRQEPPSPLSTTSERPPSGFGGRRTGGAVFSDDELAGSLNMLSLNNLDGQDDFRPRRPPRVSGSSQPSSLPTYAPHHGGSLDALRLPQHMVTNNAGASSPTSSLGAPGDEIASEFGRAGRRLASRSSSSARYSDSDSSASPERRTQSSSGPYTNDHQQPTYQPQQSNGMSTLRNGYDPLAGVFGGSGIPSPTTTFRATDALKQPPTYQSQFQDLFDNPSSSRQQRGRSASTSGGAGYETNSNTPRGPLSLSPQNSVHARQQPQPALPPLSFVGLGLQQQQQQQLRGPPTSMHSPTAGTNGAAYGYGPVSAGAAYYGPAQPIGPGAALGPLPGGVNRQRQNSLPPQPPSATLPHGPAPTGGITSGLGLGASADIQLGRGVPLYAVPRDAPLFIVEFKAARNDIFYVADPVSFYASGGGELRVGELVIVEADRGRDLGRVTHGNITTADVEAWQRQQAEQAAIASLQAQDESGGAGGSGGKAGIKELMPKKIYARATNEDIQQLQAKTADEAKALQLCQSKVRQKKLPMEVVDAEYQWDRRKLTFYFVADRRIDFRELVRELFRLYKTRIWMACLQGPPTSE